MYKGFALLLLAVFFVSCGGSEPESDPAVSSTAAEEPAPAEPPPLEQTAACMEASGFKQVGLSPGTEAPLTGAAPSGEVVSLTRYLDQADARARFERLSPARSLSIAISPSENWTVTSLRPLRPETFELLSKCVGPPYDTETPSTEDELARCLSWRGFTRLSGSHEPDVSTVSGNAPSGSLVGVVSFTDPAAVRQRAVDLTRESSLDVSISDSESFAIGASKPLTDEEAQLLNECLGEPLEDAPAEPPPE